MRILFLTPRLPYPPDRGDRLRAFHFIEHLSREHELSLVSFIDRDAERAHVPPLKAFCSDVRVVQMSARRSTLAVAWNFWRRDPLQALFYRSQAMAHLVDEVLSSARFDAVYVHLFRMAPYVANRANLYRIVDLTDVISREVTRSLPYRGAASRFVYRIEKPRIERYERWVAENFEETWLISESDRRILARDCPAANIQVVRNGVDLEYLHPTGEPPCPDSLIFVGHMGVLHNVDAASFLVERVLPRVQHEIPGCTVKIVGASPDPRVLDLANPPNVTVTGFVPDLNHHLNQASVFVAPLRFAAGVQNKVLEAMATATPVVTTSIVNEGLGAEPGRQILIADDPEAMTAQIVSLLRDGNLREKVGHAGLEFVRQTYTWEDVNRRVREIAGLLSRP